MSVSLKCIVIDDDELSVSALSALAQQHPRLELAAAFASALPALDFLANNEVDLVFLDIEMPDMNGLEFLDALEQKPMVIFTTGKEDYAVQAFEYHALDYMVKPVRPARFIQAVQHALRTFDEKNAARPTAAVAAAGQAAPRHIFVRYDNQFIKIDLDQVQWVEARGDYIDICLDDKKLPIHARMMDIEPRLPEDRFIRVHRSYIVNVSKISVVQDNMLVIGQKVIPISKNNRARLNEQLNMLV